MVDPGEQQTYRRFSNEAAVQQQRYERRGGSRIAGSPSLEEFRTGSPVGEGPEHQSTMPESIFVPR